MRARVRVKPLPYPGGYTFGHAESDVPLVHPLGRQLPPLQAWVG